MRPVRTGRLRPAAALALVLALLALTSPVPAAAAPADAGPVAAVTGLTGLPPAQVDDDDGPVQVEVTGLAPRAPLSVDEPLQVTGRLVNTGDDVLRDLSVRLLVGGVVITRSGLALAETDASTGRPRGPEVAPAATELAPGAAVGFDLRLQVGELGLGRVGAYPLQVQARGRLGEQRRVGPLGQAGTFLPWFPDGPPVPTRLAFLLPLVDRPQQTPDGALLGQGLTAALAEGGRLRATLTAGRTAAEGACDPAAAGPQAPENALQDGTGQDDGTPDGAPTPEPAPVAPPCRAEPVPVTYAVDPALLDAATTLSAEHLTVTPSGERVARPPVPAAATWLTELREALAGAPLRDGEPPLAPADLLALPYGDPDVVAVARSGTQLVGDVEQLRLLGARATQQALGVAPLETVVWPPAGGLSAAALDLTTGGGAEAVVLDPAALPARGATVGRTPGTRTALSSTGAGPLTGLVVDQGLSELLTVGPGDPGWQGARLAEQRWLVETAVLAAERPGESRTLVVAPPRRSSVRPDVAGPALLDTGRVPWLCAVALADVAAGTERCPGEPVAPVEDAEALPEEPAVPEPADGEGELAPGFLQQVAAVRERAEQLTDRVLVAGSTEAAATRARLLRARGRTLSSAWRTDPAGGRQLLALQREEVDALRSQVSLLTSGRVLLTSDTGVVEVGLSNALEQPVTVGVELNDPAEARLSSSDTALQTVGPGQQVQVRVRVEARVSGQFVVRATLLDRTGQPFGEPVELVARSTRYGRLALAVTGIGAGVLLAAAGVRLARRALRQPAGMPDDGA